MREGIWPVRSKLSVQIPLAAGDMPVQVLALAALEPRPALVVARRQVDAVEFPTRMPLHHHARQASQLLRRCGECVRVFDELPVRRRELLLLRSALGLGHRRDDLPSRELQSAQAVVLALEAALVVAVVDCVDVAVLESDAVAVVVRVVVAEEVRVLDAELECVLVADEVAVEVCVVEGEVISQLNSEPAAW